MRTPIGVWAPALVAVTIAGLAGCAPPPRTTMTPTYEAQKSAESLVSVQPKPARPAVLGNFDFEIVGDADGKGCFDRNESSHALGYLPFVNVAPQGFPSLDNYAVSAAIYDALSRAKTADTVLVTWTRTEVTGDKACAEIHGKAVRLIKAVEAPKHEGNEEHDHWHMLMPPPPPPPPPAPPPPVAAPPPPPPPPPVEEPAKKETAPKKRK